MLPGTIIVLFFFASSPKASTAFSATFSCTACSPPGCWIAAAILRIASAVASATAMIAAASPCGLVDLGLLLAFGARDEGLALAGGDVDLLLAPAFGRRDQRALLALGGDLRLHRAQDLGRRRQVLDLVAQHLHAPGQRRFVERADDRGVDQVALLEGLVELHLADHAAQRGLRQLRDGDDVVATSRSWRASGR